MTRIIDIELDEEVLKDVMTRAGTNEPKQALIEAVKEYVRPRNQKDLIKYLGTFDTLMSHEELMKMREMD